MGKEEIKVMIFGISLVLLVLGIAIVVLFIYFQQKKMKFLLEREKYKKKFETEITNSKIEIREQTLENISWEIHDNVGQLLSIAKMQLNILQPNLTENQQKELNETSELIGKCLQELRNLAKSLNPKHFKTLGLAKAIKLDYQPNQLLVEIRDHGVGFDYKKLDKTKGLGLHTMQDRAKLIGVSFNLESIKNEGTFLELICPIN